VKGDDWEKTSEIREALGDPLPTIEQICLALLKLAHAGEVERGPPMCRRESCWTDRTVVTYH
jgi:hypothetical protein